MQKALYRLLLGFIICLPVCAIAQTKIIKGEVLDKQSDEPIPFASVKFLIKGTGELTDSLGRFTVSLNDVNSNDTLRITSVGYTPVQISASELKDSTFITIQLTVL
ncbi:MAG: carboxypeptidase-like regulatory domain-containing protein, partial [Parafilimonas sp.]|nr:carboxypeptidase-like regulatory domain-containing protein [Parafilimonas sp.]